MTSSRLLANERSEGGELITQMNLLFEKYDWGLKVAVGELSLRSDKASDGRNNTLFPDAIIFADKNKREPLIGWEFKMPDVPIDDDELYSNAKDKATRMGTQVFVLWNFQNAAVYIKKNSKWPTKGNPTFFYDEYSTLLTSRERVHENFDCWNLQLQHVLEDLNNSLIAHQFSSAPIDFNIGTYVQTIATVLTPTVSDYFDQSKDVMFKIYMKKWRQNEQAELQIVKRNESSQVIANAYARSVVIRWINRFIFAHLLKRKHTSINNTLASFSTDGNLQKLSTDLNHIVQKTDFFTILHVEKYESDLPKRVIDNLNEFNLFLSQTDFSKTNADFISKLLENMVNSSVRELMGLYTTPPALATLLAGITLTRAEGNFADVTAGSGTIVRAVQDRLREFGQPESYIHEHVWAADRYNYPLQVANLNMTTPESLNLKNIVFQHNALNLVVGESITIVNPSTGKPEVLQVPTFDFITSNLPFIGGNGRNDEDKMLSDSLIGSYNGIDNKSDIYQLILLHLGSLLSDSEHARIGVITSNSWTKVKSDYNSFYTTLNKYFDVEMVIIPEKSRWFKNAEVSATIIVLKNKSKNTKSITRLIKLSSDYATDVADAIDDILSVNPSSQFYTEQRLTPNMITSRLNIGLSIESMFENQDWLDIVSKQMTPLKTFIDGKRGTRTGRDKLFITKKLKTDPSESVPFVKNPKEINSFEINSTSAYYFYTTDSLGKLQKDGKSKTIDYIQSVENTSEAKKQREKHGEQWFTGENSPQMADFVTAINPGKRFFWARLAPRAAVNQRLTAFTVKNEFKADTELLHALLNCILSQYMIAGSGFGRGLGATDLTSNGIKQTYILDIRKLNTNAKLDIVNAWRTLKHKPIVTIFEQVTDPDWKNFNYIVLNAFHLDPNLYTDISTSLIDLISRRDSVRS
ncbi:DNA methylase subunit (HsdM) [Fructobacillus fructosus]|uniref:hypothetical protein n=1 Tax=Fructobacillus fructosus TaxID=1631 RepID=UPI002D88FE60|nr:DNA methylase subunit (HsdM) [Fructobacillus fructosus]